LSERRVLGLIRSFLILDDGGLTMMRPKMGTGTLVLLYFLIPFKFLPNRLPLWFRDINLVWSGTQKAPELVQN